MSPPIRLVTGGAGFIGCSIVRELVRQGEAVRVLDDLSAGQRDNLPPSGTPGFEFIEGDILDADCLDGAMAGVATVFHHAAIASVPRSVAEPLVTNEVNVTGTLQVLQAARRAGVGRVVYAASSSAYGDTPDSPKQESMAPSPQSPYAVAKLAGEFYCRSFQQVYGLETVALRYFNVFGPRQDPRSEYAAVIPRFITAALKREPVVVHGDGEQSRDFCFIQDVVAANLAAARADAVQVSGQTFNIARGEGVSLNRLLVELAPLVGQSAIARRPEPARPGDVRHSIADITRARARLHYEPTVTLAAGLARTVAWFRDGRDGLER